MGKHVDAGEGEIIRFAKCLENVQGVKALSVILNTVVWAELWVSDPAAPTLSLLVSPRLSWIPSLPVSLRQQAAKTQTTVSVQSPPDRSLAADQKYSQTKTYIK